MHGQGAGREHKHRVIVIERGLLRWLDEEHMLIHIYLDAGCSSVEILEGLRTVLQSREDGEDRAQGERAFTRTSISFGSPLR